MKLNDITTRLIASSDDSRMLFQSLRDMAMIDTIPTVVNQLTVIQYDDLAFLEIENAFYLLKNAVNQLVKTCGRYNLVDLMGNKPEGIGYFGVNEIAISSLIKTYDSKLSEIEATINKLKEIFELNGLIKEQ